ncbi:MAG: hypothetical protein HY721_16905 [Planctomycetes bacterium]|nr:hypothetical protein [Planctomycetota bacterium]
MRKRPCALLTILLAAAGAALLFWAIAAGRKELERERAMERPVEAPRRLSRGASGDVVVTVDAAEQARSGIRTAALEAREAPREARAHGRVLDPEPLVSLAMEFALAEAALPASRAEHERAKALHASGGGLAQRALEAAEAQLRADEARARTAARRLRDGWGVSIAGLDPRAREDLVDRLVQREAALVRAHLPPGEALAGKPLQAEVSALGEEERRLPAGEVLEAPTIDEALQGRAFLLRIDAPGAGLLPGAAVTAHLRAADEPLRGVFLPRSALVRHEGRAWAYVQEAPERFARREVRLERPLEDGWLASGPLGPGERAVVSGAQMLLSEELRARISLAEEEE